MTQEWNDPFSQAILQDLWDAGKAYCAAIEICIAHAKTLPEGTQRTHFLNSVGYHIQSGIDEQRGGYTEFQRVVEKMKGGS